MAKLSLVIEAESAEELRTIIIELGELDISSPGPHLPRSQAQGEDTWTSEDLAQVWARTATNARALWAELARRPEGYGFDELQQQMELTGRDIGGRFSSLGFALRAFPGKPHPIQRDYAWRLYRMDTRVAETIMRLARGV